MSNNRFLQSLLILLCSTVFIQPILHAQNVGIGVATPAFKLDVRNGSINTDSAYRIRTGIVLSVKGLGNTFTGLDAGRDNVSGVFNTVNGNSAFTSNTTGLNNTAIGVLTLSDNTTGSYNTATGHLALTTNNTGYYNTGIGTFALLANTSGNNNSANGYQALNHNTTGSYNTASGADALYQNGTGDYNSATGSLALRENTTGSFNTASGVEALRHNTIGEFNAAHGYLALFSNQSGSNNAALGFRSLFSLTAGLHNVGIGYEALTSSQGTGNIGIGSGADVNPVGISNVIVMGYNTTVTASNTARFGNSSTVSYGGWAGWTNVSDGRFKKNIKENVPGINFINKLRPVTYTLDAMRLDEFYHKNENSRTPLSKETKAFFETALQEKSQIVYTGFIAQEVEATAKQLGFDFSGVDAAKNENDTYGLRYAEFVVPLVKAVQEQQVMIEELKKQNTLLQQRITQLERKN